MKATLTLTTDETAALLHNVVQASLGPDWLGVSAQFIGRPGEKAQLVMVVQGPDAPVGSLSFPEIKNAAGRLSEAS